MWKSISLVAVTVLVSACGSSLIASRGSNPVIQDQFGIGKDIGIIATTVDRRAITFRDVPEEHVAEAGISVEFCPEPPPDAGTDSINKTLAELSANLPEGPEGAAKFESLLETTTQLLFARSQGVQLFRDGMYNLCILHMNRVINEDQANILIGLLLTNSTQLIKDEIEAGKVIGAVQPREETAEAQTQ